MTSNDLRPKTSNRESRAVACHEHGNGIFVLRIADTVGNNTLSGDLIGQLLEALEVVRNTSAVKVLLLQGTPACFLSGKRTYYNEAVARELYQSIAAFPYPVVAVMQGDALGAGFLVGALCDFLVCSETAVYGYTDPQSGLFPTPEEDRLLARRFGRAHATELLYQTTRATGKQLQAKSWSCPILPAQQVEQYALKLAHELAHKSQDSLRLLKRQLARPILEAAKALRRVAQPPSEPQAYPSHANARLNFRSKRIQVDVSGENILVLRIRDTGRKHEIKALVADLAALFAQLDKRWADSAGPYRAVVLTSEYPGFFPEAEEVLSVDAVLSLQHVLLRASLPVIAVLNSRATGCVWLVSQFCDAAVYQTDGTYCAADLLRSPELARLAAWVFAHRFDGHVARELLLSGAAYTGAELQTRVGTLPVASEDQALPEAFRLAQFWTQWPFDTVVSWKKHAALDIREALDIRAALDRVPAGQTPQVNTEVSAEQGHADAPVPIDLNTEVISATAHPEGVLVVRMEDRDAKNMFSEEFTRGMAEVFAHVEATPRYKVVVLTGYDNYFASGGTQEALVAIQEGKLKFTDDATYQLALACKVPVIAAMQGHGIGAGLSLGLFADFPMLSEESKYLSPYMGYGFTPGVGATLIVPEKLGHDLARDTLFTAREYAGSELKERGVPLAVHPRKTVLDSAMQLARQIARHSRASLIDIKQQLNGSLHDRLPEYCEQELAMHEVTFVGQAETLRQIQTTFNRADGQVDDQRKIDPADVPDQTEPPVTPARARSGEGVPEVVASLKQLMAHELHLEEDELDEDTQFMDLGLDSITGVTWIRKINERYGLALLATIVYSYPTLKKLGRHVKEEVEKLGGAAEQALPESVQQNCEKSPVGRETPPAGQGASSGATSARSSSRDLVSWRRKQPSAMEPLTKPATVANHDPVGARAHDIGGRTTTAGPATTAGAATTVRQLQAIAVIGMAGQFPLARNIDEFWRNIAAGRNCISQIPSTRWDVDAYFQEGEPVQGKTNCRYMGLLDEYDQFDPLFFNISPAEAKAMDPQQRLFLQACWHSIEHAGYNPKSLVGSRCGVFAGVGAGEYSILSRKVRLSAHGFTGGANAILAARIAYFLDLQGPCLSIDTACSSSLVAIANACDSLTSGASDMALAGGVYVDAGPSMHIMTSQAGMLSTDGKCYTFDKRANGFVPGEAVGVLLLKRLEDAERDHDIIHAVIQGWGVNQDGRTNGITAPNPESQARLQREVHDRYQIDPSQIQLIEAHGTATALGDPIEVEGLKKAFKGRTDQVGYCALGSVKSNIGHCLAAAGVAGLIKLVLALQHRQLPPTIHFEQLNEHIDLQGSPFFVNTRLQDWRLDGAKKRQAAVSSFGYSGTNAHVVVSEYSPASRTSPSGAATEGARFIVPLSARTADQLQQKCQDLLSFIRNEGRFACLAEIAYTLQVGREAMEERVGFVVGSLEQLAAKLAAFIQGRRDTTDSYRGQVRANKEGISALGEDDELREAVIANYIAGKKLAKLLKLWVKGLELNWKDLYGATPPQRIVLPTYPFAKERYWIDAADLEQEQPASALHPELDESPADLLDEQIADQVDGEAGILAEACSGDLRDGPLPGESAELRGAQATQPLFFEEFWREEALRAPGRAAEADGPLSLAPGTPVIVFADGEDSERLREEGARGETILVRPAATFRQTSDQAYDCPLDDSAAIQHIIRETATRLAQPVAVVYAWARGRGKPGVHSIFALFKAIQPCSDLVSAVTLVGHYDPAAVATCWDYSWVGFERSLKLLLPGVKVAVLYTDTAACSAAQWADARCCGGVVWYRGEQRLVLSVRPISATETTADPVIKQGGSYLITGGCGHLGLTFARHLARNYKARLTLIGRRPLSADIQRQLDELVRSGAQTAHYAAVDVGNPQELTVWAQQLPARLTGVFHAAGIEPEGAFHERSATEVEEILHPKAGGTLALDAALSNHPLDFVCYFSSSAGVLGDFGSCDYAIANRFQMAYGVHRHNNPQLPGRTLVINWPLWNKPADRQRGMGPDQPQRTAFYLKSSGQEAVDEMRGVQIWQDIMHAGQVQTLVMLGSPTRIEGLLQRVYHTAAPAGGATRPAASTHPTKGAQRKVSASAHRDLSSPERLQRELRQLISTALSLDPGRLDDTTNLADYGFDSISLAAFAKTLTSHFALEVTPALFFNYSTVQQLVDYFMSEHQSHFQQLYGSGPSPTRLPQRIVPSGAATTRKSGTRKPSVARAEAGTDRNRDPIAIIGMSGRFPQANNPEQLWSLLAEGRSGLTEIPRLRWNWRDYFTAPGHSGNRISTNLGGFIDGVDEFDPLFFEISPLEAQEMDPAERALLMEAYHAIEDARLSPGSLRGANVGVFVGMEEGQYGLIADQGVTTGGAAMISSRLSYFLDLHGPAIAINTACSSGLVALHQAATSLRQGECESALVASVALSLAPRAWVKMSEAGMISETGQCLSFSSKANGIGIGEAVVVLVLKPLSAAVADGDRIYGLIKASGINFDGKTNGVTAPNGRMQAKLIEDIYSRNGIDIDDVSHIVAHGTGTRLGDPVELNALDEAFRKLRLRQDSAGERKARCAITSCKTNLGHTMAASGLVSLVGLLKGMEHRQIPASLHCEDENPYVAWRDSQFYINKSTQDWHRRDGRPLMGAVSAFGRSGTNAHVIIEEHRPAVAAAAPLNLANSEPTRVLVPLAARTSEQLTQKARELLDFIAKPVDLVALAYTLQVAREPMSERVAFIVESLEQLTARLNAYLRGELHIQDVVRGSVSSRSDGMSLISQDDDMREAIGKWLAARKLSKLAHLWVQGGQLDWQKLYEGAAPQPQRVSVPTYPFAKERYWIDGVAPERNAQPLELAGTQPARTRRLEAIEEIIDRVGSGSIEAAQAIASLKKVV